jgi:hypothetical protein
LALTDTTRDQQLQSQKLFTDRTHILHPRYRIQGVQEGVHRSLHRRVE